MKKSSSTQFLLTTISIAALTLVSQAQAQQADSLGKVEVTGSLIKHLESETALPVTTIKAEEFVARGITTVADIMMTLPQSLSLAPSNAGAGSNINLRGLGVNRTLVLVNGRRLANEATADGFANLDVIPFSAIERVEVLNDGASSIYGSDAIGGVVNFITKKSYNGSSMTAQMGKPTIAGGGDEQRISFITGKGDLQEDGFNWFATVDGHQRSRLAESDREFLSNAAALTALGRAPSLGTGSYAYPANVVSTSSSKTPGNPYYSTGCQAPYSTQAANNTCLLNADNYNTALYGNQQLSFYTKGTIQHDADHSTSFEFIRGQEYINSVRNPATSAAISYGGTTGFSSVAAPVITSASSPYYPGGSAGVPAIPGLSGPLTVQYSAPGMAATKDMQVNNRFVLNDQGIMGDWDYKAGANYGISNRNITAAQGIYNAQELNAGISNGIINPFGAQSTAGQNYLNSIDMSGTTLRAATSTFLGVDGTISREIGKLEGGAMTLALGGDIHQDTNKDQKMLAGLYAAPVSAAPTWANSQRIVTALFGEIDMPVTKKLTLNAAVRDDRYSDVGNTINPKASFRFQPSKELMFRGSASTGFRAPTLSDEYGYTVAGANTTTSAPMDDPLLCPSATPNISGTGKAIAGQTTSIVCNAKQPLRTGATTGLLPEKSKTFTLGTVIQPNKDAIFTVDYWHIDMSDMIASIPQAAFMSNPAAYSSLFVRNPDGSLAYINDTLTNLGGQRVSGIDLTANYQFPTTSSGIFKVGLDGTYLTQFDNQIVNGGPWVSNLGQFGLAGNGTVSSLPIVSFRWRHNLRLQWMKGDWSTMVTETYMSSYMDQNTTPVAADTNHVIPAYSVVNLMVTYKGFKNMTISGGINNLFDVMPSATNNSSYPLGYLSSAQSPLGRELITSLTYKF
jgi:iron complex outermembrane receptor protein